MKTVKKKKSYIRSIKVRILKLNSQAHLHVSEIEEVVHVSGGSVLVIRDENLQGKKNSEHIIHIVREGELRCEPQSKASG